MLTTTKTKCATQFTNCLYLNDANPTLCDTCQINYLPTTDKLTCATSINNCLYINNIDQS